MLLQRLQKIAGRFPGKVAVQRGSLCLSYSALQEKAKEFGERLRGTYGDAQRALIVIENSLSYPVVLYGCWSVGITAVPINANAKSREIRKIIGHVSPSICIASDRSRAAEEAAEASGIPLIQVHDNDMVAPPGKSKSNSDVDWEFPIIPVNDEALILYTSGTSGNPKGVVLTHKNLEANTAGIIEYLALSDSDSVVVVLPFHYSYGNSLLHTHIAVGGTLFIADSMMYPQQVTDCLRATKATGFAGVPSTLALLIAKTDFPKDPPSLRYITQAGGPMGRKLTKEVLRSIDSGTSLFIMYGQTEATARLTWLPPERLVEKLGSVGKPIPGVRIRVVDECGQDCAPGVVGEIIASGANIMKGYWNNQKATSEALRNGWLHTGDLGYTDKDGFVYVVSRVSEMIKSGAHRINPAEIEEAILELDGIEEVAVCGIPDELLGEVAVAFVVGQSFPEQSRQVIAHCRQSLSIHKVPRDVVFVNNLPRTPNGKVRKATLVESYLGKRKVS